jgi:predicted nucleotidyltransferase
MVIGMSDLLDDRRGYVRERLEALNRQLTTASEIVGDKACVYVTGSVARGEATTHSDLDLFIVGQTDDGNKPRLSRLNQILLKAELIKATKACDFPEFSGDGEWLGHHTVNQLVCTLGKADDELSVSTTKPEPRPIRPSRRRSGS